MKKGRCNMKWLKGYRIRLMLVGFIAAIVLCGGLARADFTWTQKADMPITKLQHSTNVVGGKIYSIGGWNAIGEWNPQWDALKRVDEYDPSTDTWTRKADMPTARGYTSTCVVNEKIYVIGGDAGLEPPDLCIPTVEVYDPVTDTWTRKADMPTRRFWFSTNVVDGIIYVIGGKPGLGDGSPHLSTVEAYDPVTDTWTSKADMPTRRSFSSTCVVDGKIYVIGGAMPGKSAVEAYDPTTDTWTRKAPMPTARYLLGTSLVGGRIYAIGGWRHSINGPTYSTVEVYDPETDTWTKGVDIPVTTAGMSTSVVDGKIYVIGGSTSTHAGEHWVLTSAVYASDIIVDFNGDGIVDAADICLMLDYWLTDEPFYDIAPQPFGDGIVDVQDLIILAEHLFEEFPPVE
jgi:N-acetylneuraminic acid mutarotase